MNGDSEEKWTGRCYFFMLGSCCDIFFFRWIFWGARLGYVTEISVRFLLCEGMAHTTNIFGVTENIMRFARTDKRNW